MNTLDHDAPSGGVRRTKAHPLWVAGMVALHLKHRDQFESEGLGADLLAMVGEANIEVANEILERRETGSLTPYEATAFMQAVNGGPAYMALVPAQRRYPAGVTA